MTAKKKFFDKISWVVIAIIIVVNFYLLLELKQHSPAQEPLKYLDIKKPTLVVIMQEFECVSCVRGLLFLNDLYAGVKEEGSIDFQGIVLSRDKTDKKGISGAFKFPFHITGDFKILQRLNMNRTPIIIGLSKERRIVYCELIPIETTLSETYIRKGVLDRLYYSLSW
jgi:uncharacterized membrane protein